MFHDCPNQLSRDIAEALGNGDRRWSYAIPRPRALGSQSGLPLQTEVRRRPNKDGSLRFALVVVRVRGALLTLKFVSGVHILTEGVLFTKVRPPRPLITRAKHMQ